MNSLFLSIFLINGYSPTHRKVTNQDTVMVSQFMSLESATQLMDFVRAQEPRKEKDLSGGITFQMTIQMMLRLSLELHAFLDNEALNVFQSTLSHFISTTAQWGQAENRIHHYFKEKPPAVRDAHIIKSLRGREKRKHRTTIFSFNQTTRKKIIHWKLTTLVKEALFFLHRHTIKKIRNRQMRGI